MQKINTETYLKKRKTKRENMEKNRYHYMSEEKILTRGKNLSI